jgi:N-acetylmuramoyl-L-alanine amidase
VRQVVWEQEATDRVRVTLRLSEEPFGYLAFWDPARGAFVLRVRRTPAVDRARPLRGLTIVVDAGHPPGGATGPTGLWEPVAVLPVAERVRDLLRERGATVVMTRTTAEPVPLGDRGVLARRANGHAFVSVHLNAFPDGVNPFANAGRARCSSTSTRSRWRAWCSARWCAASASATWASTTRTWPSRGRRGCPRS